VFTSDVQIVLGIDLQEVSKCLSDFNPDFTVGFLMKAKKQ